MSNALARARRFTLDLEKHRRAGGDFALPPLFRLGSSGRLLRVLNAVAASTDGYGFSITDSRGKPLVHFEFEHENKAEETHRISARPSLSRQRSPYL